MGFVYKITNKLNGKVYIGKTEYHDALIRWKEHLNDYKKKHEQIRPLYRAFSKYGVENFEFNILEETENTSEREMYYIRIYNSYVGFENSNGYNATLGGDGKKYLELNEQEVIRKYKEYGNHISNTAEYFGVSPKTISNILRSHHVELNSNIENVRNIQGVGIKQIDVKSGQIVNIFQCIADANRYFGKDRLNGNIRSVLRGKTKTAFGYYWQYI